MPPTRCRWFRGGGYCRGPSLRSGRGVCSPSLLLSFSLCYRRGVTNHSLSGTGWSHLGRSAPSAMCHVVT
ncbi:MAG: hypothetical protein CVV20_03225 [Gemmatimonadetes bacterium HGW-Gemmatimonadetes-1]|nr:MAG: hypothetical protein CVV20_03225 [Gemmatimonadetes bacterium HGW-Gemmatimonadetes-1]